MVAPAVHRRRDARCTRGVAMSAQRPIRVMRIIARLNVGGPALHVTLLAERLSPPEFESTLVCGRIGPGEGDMAYLAEERGITPVFVPELGRELHPLRDLVTLVKLWRLMRRLKPDVVHRSEEHTSELQSRPHLVCRLLLEKK